MQRYRFEEVWTINYVSFLRPVSRNKRMTEQEEKWLSDILYHVSNGEVQYEEAYDEIKDFVTLKVKDAKETVA